MKVIFLDIDGVLNTEVFTRAFFGILKRLNTDRPEAKKIAKAELRDDYGVLFDPMAEDMLKWIVEATGAKIVISSTWRMSGLKIMQEMWTKRGLPGEVIDVTPNHMKRTGCTLQRGKEINEWLSSNPVESYVIIDDDSDMEPEQLFRFVQTDYQYGLTYKAAVKCVDVLNNAITSPPVNADTKQGEARC